MYASRMTNSGSVCVTSPQESAGNKRRRAQPIGGCDRSWGICERGMPVLLPALSSMSPSYGKLAFLAALGRWSTTEFPCSVSHRFSWRGSGMFGAGVPSFPSREWLVLPKYACSRRLEEKILGDRYLLAEAGEVCHLPCYPSYNNL